jgi:mRNA interferase RelE/StbE
MSVNEQPAYEVRLRSRRVQRELDSLQESDHQRVVARIGALAHDARPQGCEKLYDDIYRVRVGDFRIIYLIDEEGKRIEVGGIRRRSERTYKGFEDLFR